MIMNSKRRCRDLCGVQSSEQYGLRALAVDLARPSKVRNAVA
jgi:hypothetical protein